MTAKPIDDIAALKAVPAHEPAARIIAEARGDEAGVRVTKSPRRSR